MQQQFTQKAPINRNQILMTFRKYGYSADSMINKDKMISIFKTESINKKQNSMNHHIIEQIWNQSEATSKGQIAVNTIADILQQAQLILIKRMDALTKDNGKIQQLDQLIRQSQFQVKQFARYYGEDRNQMNKITKQLMNMQIQQKQNYYDLQSFKQDYQTINGIFFLQQAPNFTQYVVPNRQQQSKKSLKSGQLLTLFHITNLMLLLEFLILGSFRMSFLTLSGLFHSYYLLLFGIEAPANFTYILLHYGLSIVADVAFIVINVVNKYQIMPIQHSSYHTYALILGGLLIVSIALRILSIILYINLKIEYSSKVTYYFVILGQIFPPKKTEQITQYACYSIVQKNAIYQANQKINRKGFQFQIKEQANQHATMNSPRYQLYNDYSSVKQMLYMDLDE